MKLAISALLIGSAAAFAPSASNFRASTTALDANIVDTLATLEGPGLVWGADGIAVGKEESDFKEFDNFTLFTERLKSTGVDAVLAGPGPFTVFAVTDNAIKSYEKTVGPVTADVLKYCIVKGEVPSASVGSADLSNELGKSLTYSRKFRKDFVDDAILGEKTFGPFSDFPVDVKCDNGIIHSIGLCLDPAYSAVGGGVGATQL